MVFKSVHCTCKCVQRPATCCKDRNRRIKEVAGFGMQQSIMSNSQLGDGLGAKERKAYSCSNTLNINLRASESRSCNDTRTTMKGMYKIMKIKLDLLFFCPDPKRN